MQDEINAHMKSAKEDMEHSLEHLSKELGKLRAGKASPVMLQGVMVEYYGNPTPLGQVANISARDSSTLSIQPWEKSMIGPIEKAIFEANLGFTPQNNGESVMINVPPLTEERRKELVKQSKAFAEDAKVSIRSARHKIMDFLKKAMKDGYPEDAGKRKEDEVEKMVQNYYDKVVKMINHKEEEIMKV